MYQPHAPGIVDHHDTHQQDCEEHESNETKIW